MSEVCIGRLLQWCVDNLSLIAWQDVAPKEGRMSLKPFADMQKPPFRYRSSASSDELALRALSERRSSEKSGRRDSNPRQPAWKAGTLPTELLPHE